jgi:hypothetical protein
MPWAPESMMRGVVLLWSPESMMRGVVLLWCTLFYFLHISLLLIRSFFFIVCSGQNIKAHRCTLDLVSHLGFFLPALISMANVGGSQLNIGAPVEKWGRSRPHGSKNKSKDPAVVASSSAPIKRRPGRPLGSKNKTKMSTAASGLSALPRNSSPPPSPRIYSFFCIASAQCREI